VRDITFGQYYPKNSPVHRLDPRTKLIASVVYIVAVFFCVSYYSYLACFLFIALTVALSTVSPKMLLKSIKSVIFIILISVVINIFSYSDGTILWKWWKIGVTDAGLIFASKMAMRLIFLVMGTSLVTFTTTPTALTDGLESLMSPLKIIKFPVHDVALIMNIALRFIPTFTEEIDKIINAQKARGASFDTGGIIKRAKALIPILIPLFVSAFRRADELALALDARCYSLSPKRTKMKKLTLRFFDILALLFMAAFLTGIILMKVYCV